MPASVSFGQAATDETAVTPVEMIARALKNNYDVKIQEIDVAIAADRVEGARGEFDPIISINIGRDDTTRRMNSRDFVTIPELNLNIPTDRTRIFNETIHRGSVGIGGRLHTGTRYDLTTGLTRTRNYYTRSDSSPFDPEYQATTRLTLVQPLLRNAGRDVNMAQIHVLEAEGVSTLHQTRLGIETVMAQVLSVCFELEFAVENIRVKEQAVELAESLLQENTRRVEEGRMSPLDVTQAEARVAEAREELIQARNFHAQRQNLLRELTKADYDFDEPYVTVAGVESALPKVELDRDALVAEMFARSPIYHAAMETAEAERIRLLFAEDQIHPQVDLILTAGYNGLESSFEQSFKDYNERDHPDWGVGIEVSFPIGERSARARMSEQKRRRTQALLRVKQAEVQLLAALDNALREVEAGLERRTLIEDVVRLAESALNSEERRLVSGVTTSYNVLTQQRELSDARSRALAADAEVRRATTQLLLVQGSLAESLGFALNFE